MKKLVVCLLFGIFILGLVGVAQMQSAQNGQNSNSSSQTNQATQNQGEDSEIQVANQIRAGNYENSKGKKFQIQEKENERLRIHSGNVSADCDCNLTQEKIQNKTELKIKLSNGMNAEIKIMPDEASETAIERLKLNVCSEENNCVIELKEVGKGNEVRAAYEIRVQRHFRILGLFKTKAQVDAQVDADNGEIINVKKPWWAFLASESEE